MKICLSYLFLLFIFPAAVCGLSFAGSDTGVPEDVSRPRPGKAPPKRLTAEEVVKRMKEKLGLSAEQAAQIISVIEEEMETMKTIMEQEGVSGRGTRSAGMEKMKALHESTEKKLALYLTAEQMAKWKEDRPGGPPPVRKKDGEDIRERRDDNE